MGAFVRENVDELTRYDEPRNVEDADFLPDSHLLPYVCPCSIASELQNTYSAMR